MPSGALFQVCGRCGLEVDLLILCSFIHEPTMVSLVTSGTAPRVLLLAVCASVLRLGRDHPTPESLKIADAWALEARQILLNVIFGRFVTTDLMVGISTLLTACSRTGRHATRAL